MKKVNLLVGCLSCACLLGLVACGGNEPSKDSEKETLSYDLKSSFHSNDSGSDIEVYLALSSDNKAKVTFKNDFNGNGAIQDVGAGTWTINASKDEIASLTLEDFDMPVDTERGEITIYLGLNMNGIFISEEETATWTVIFEYKDVPGKTPIENNPPVIEGDKVDSKITVECPESITVANVAYLRAGVQNPEMLQASNGEYAFENKAGDRIAITVKAPEGTTAIVTIDGKDTQAMFGMNFVEVDMAATHTIKVGLVSNIEVTGDEGVASYKVAYLVAGNQNPNFITENEGKYTFNNFAGDKVAIQVIVAEGKQVDKVVIDGKECAAMFGMYFTDVAVVGTHTINVTTK